MGKDSSKQIKNRFRRIRNNSSPAISARPEQSTLRPPAVQCDVGLSQIRTSTARCLSLAFLMPVHPQPPSVRPRRKWQRVFSNRPCIFVAGSSAAHSGRRTSEGFGAGRSILNLKASARRPLPTMSTTAAQSMTPPARRRSPRPREIRTPSLSPRRCLL